MGFDLLTELESVLSRIEQAERLRRESFTAENNTTGKALTHVVDRLSKRARDLVDRIAGEDA